MIRSEIEAVGWDQGQEAAHNYGPTLHWYRSVADRKERAIYRRAFLRGVRDVFRGGTERW